MFEQRQLQALYKFAVALCNDHEQAYDLVQITVERCLSRPDIKNVEAYARQILRNSYLDIYRRQQRFPEEPFDELSTPNADFLETIMVNDFEVEQVWTLLTDEERELMYLWAVEEYTIQEIADIQKKPKGTLLSKVHRIKARIKTALQQESKAK